jgi:hypothetical protein
VLTSSEPFEMLVYAVRSLRRSHRIEAKVRTAQTSGGPGSVRRSVGAGLGVVSVRPGELALSRVDTGPYSKLERLAWHDILPMLARTLRRTWVPAYALAFSGFRTISTGHGRSV